MEATLRQDIRRARRARRVRAKMHGTEERPRLTVFRSNQHIYVQAINDDSGLTVAAGNDVKMTKGTKTERSIEVAKQVAAALKTAKFKKVTFDRGQYMYHGRVKAVAETLRAEGIEV